MMADSKSGKSWLPDLFKSPAADASNETSDERSSLLPKPNGNDERLDQAATGDTYELENEGSTKSKLVFAEFILLLKSSIPVILAYTLQNSLQTVSVLVVGRLSPESLATAAFSYMFAMSTAWLIALGGTTALDTLASSTFTGSKNKHDLGVLLQRSFLVLGLFYVPVAILWLFSEPVFLALGQEPALSRDSAKFLGLLIPGGLGYIYFEALKKYLQAQGNVPQSYQSSKLTRSRNNETGDLRSPHHFTIQCTPQLPLRLHL
jgi:MATE family multidrug resistance protein